MDTASYWLLVFVAIVTGLWGALYLYMSVVFTYWKKRSVPYLKPSFPAGNIKNIVLGKKAVGEVYHDLYKELHGHKFAGIYEIHKPALFVRDPELIKHFLVKEFESFHDHHLPFDEELDPLGNNLLQLTGIRWRKLRAKLSPTFTSGKMKMMFQTLVDCSVELGKYLEEPAERSDVLEMKDVMTKFTTDVIASCAFGIQCNCFSDPDAEFRHWGTRIFNPNVAQRIKNLLYMFFPYLLMKLRIPTSSQDITKFFTGIVKETIEYREKNNVKTNDFLQLLIQLKNDGIVEGDDESEGTTESFTKLSLNEVSAHAFLFFTGGFETSATTLSFALYELAVNPDIQDKVRAEIDIVLNNHGGSITYEGVQQMAYLDKVVSETLRKYPPINILDRRCTKDYKIPDTDVIVEEGIRVAISTMGLHYDPQYYPIPEKFDPERFSEEVKSKRPHYTYLPFGEGPRQCIGMRFGLMQTKVGLITALSKFEFHVCNKTPIPIVYDTKTFVPSPVGGFHLKIKKRTR